MGLVMQELDIMLNSIEKTAESELWSMILLSLVTEYIDVREAHKQELQ